MCVYVFSLKFVSSFNIVLQLENIQPQLSHKQRADHD